MFHDPTVTRVPLSTPGALVGPTSGKLSPSHPKGTAAATAGSVALIDEQLHQELAASGVVEDTLTFAEAHGYAHDDVVGLCKSLASNGFIETEKLERSLVLLTKDGVYAAENGTPEARVFFMVPDGGSIDQDELLAAAGDAGKVGKDKAVQNKWLTVTKGEGKSKLISRATATIDDTVQAQLRAVHATGVAPAEAELKELKKRKLLESKQLKSLKVMQGKAFLNWGQKPVADLTHEMIVQKTWKEQIFKPLNLDAAGKAPAGGALHPLLKVRTMFREIFLEMGFEEMETNRYVESSFWNFDALFQPQQHPARDEQDTFFIKKPAATLTVPPDYLQRVKATHENGGSALDEAYNAHSVGWRYEWEEAESRKNLLRTHTTAVSSRTLYALAQAVVAGGTLKPQKYFSIDRVFRNEALDATHLAEFHQVEGFIIGYDLSLGNLMGEIADFYRRLGPEFYNIRFKPTYNPYTEPSMEFHAYHPTLKKWVEVGNSGVFRPEMLRPMGFPENVSVIAWGMSLERPTMIKYGVSNIRDLFGHKIDLNYVRSHPVVRWT